MILWRQLWHALIIVSPAILILAARAAWDLIPRKRTDEQRQ